VGAAYWILPDYSEIINEQRSRNGTLILDRNSKIIRLLPDDQGSFRIWCEIEQAPNDLKKCILAAEDKRFFYHPGFDPIAILRALYSNLSAGRVKSGASTITQQVIRLIHPRPRTYKSKLIELLSACKMEIQLSKEQILELYINLCPMGGNIRGVAFAAKKYFGKSVDRINMAESAILAVLPRSPSKFDPMHAKGQKRLFLEKDRLLKRMAELGWIESDTLKIMTGPMASFKNRPVPLEAPHFVDFLMTKNVCQQSLIKTTIDLNLQHSMEEIFRSQIKRLHKLGIEQAGLIIASVKDSEVLAMIGSLEYATKYQGFNNATLALRGAGSVLKPFLYAVAIEQGKNSFTEIPDTYKTYATPQGDYQPYNADRRWYGPVSLRLALGDSLNVPAVKTLQEIGVGEFYKHLERLGLINEKSDPPEHYGLGLAIGNIEVNLFRLVQAYGALARLGIYKQLKVICGKTEEQHRVFSPETTYLISHILADPCARLLTFGNPYYYDFGFPVSVKTGTS
ncbi:MAG: transglycosylase domain-containing protein, partial [Candidatus Hadarchaeum sp.]